MTSLTSDEVRLVDLCAELRNTLMALSYPAYKGQVYEALSEVVEYHRPALTPDVVDLVDETLRLLEPGSPPSPEQIASVGRRWDAAMAGPRPLNRNVDGLWWALSEVPLHLESPNYVMASDLCEPLVSEVIVPVTTSRMGEAGFDPVNSLADLDSADVQMLVHLIDRAKAALSAERQK
jgi:hypothetical protein